jgi:hypothetical protein
MSHFLCLTDFYDFGFASDHFEGRAGTTRRCNRLPACAVALLEPLYSSRSAVPIQSDVVA